MVIRDLLQSALALTAVLPLALAGQAGDEIRRPGGETGIVGVIADRETQRPVEGAVITLWTLEGEPISVLSDASGRFVFGRLADGRFNVSVERIGYQEFTGSVTFRADVGLRLTIDLVQEAVELEPLIVVSEERSRSLSAQGFYERQQRGIGRFVTREQIDSRNSVRMSDVLETMAGVRMSTAGRSRQQAVVLLRGGCVADVYLDGIRTVTPFPVDALVQPSDVEAVEVYHGSETPARYGMTNCGTVLIWTRVPNPGIRGSQTGSNRVLGVLGLTAIVFLLMR
jgi:hypothetical protein